MGAVVVSTGPRGEGSIVEYGSEAEGRAVIDRRLAALHADGWAVRQTSSRTWVARRPSPESQPDTWRVVLAALAG